MFPFDKTLNVKLGKNRTFNCLTMLKYLKEPKEGTYYVSCKKKNRMCKGLHAIYEPLKLSCFEISVAAQLSTFL